MWHFPFVSIEIFHACHSEKETKLIVIIMKKQHRYVQTSLQY